mmetsp:Transcript_12589/g.27193  ORF Transcript_12589/g.27193 Transcript_12589/m.27193 type:complete len:286 (+) Transcript_12589:818-1675(+)
MPHIQDVAAWPRLQQHLVGRLHNGLLWPKQDHGVDVALHLDTLAQGLAGHRHVHRPVEAHHVGAGATHQLQLASASICMQDDGHVWVLGLERLGDALGIGQAELGKLVGGQVVRPGVKQLDDLCTALNLVAGIHDERLSQVVEHGVQDVGAVVHDLLCLLAVLVRLALHGVGGQGPGRANEAEQGGVAVVHLLAQAGEDGVDEGQAGGGVVHGAQRLDLLHAAHWLHDGGALALDHVKLNTQGGQGGEDVGEEDDAVGLEGAQGLQRQLNGNVGGLGAHAEGVLV